MAAGRAVARPRRWRAAAGLALGVALAGAATAGPAEDAMPGAAARAAPDSKPAGDDLTGDDIYRRVLENRFRSFHQETSLVSGDRGGNEQKTKLRMTWQDWRDDQDQPVDGFYSKTLIVYSAPFDLRYTAYLVIQKENPPNDQFIYLPSRRRVRRANLRSETIFGTDFSFEDIVPREFESASYVRKPDEEVDGVPCFVVEATPKPDQNSEYSRFLLYIEKAHFVPLRTRYWNTAELEVKELVSPASSIREFDGVYLPMTATMRNLQQDSYSVATIDSLEPNPELTKTTFDPRRLEGH